MQIKLAGVVRVVLATLELPLFSFRLPGRGIHNLPPTCERSSRLQLSSSISISQPSHSHLQHFDPRYF